MDKWDRTMWALAESKIRGIDNRVMVNRKAHPERNDVIGRDRPITASPCSSVRRRLRLLLLESHRDARRFRDRSMRRTSGCRLSRAFGDAMNNIRERGIAKSWAGHVVEKGKPNSSRLPRQATAAQTSRACRWQLSLSSAWLVRCRYPAFCNQTPNDPKLKEKKKSRILGWISWPKERDHPILRKYAATAISPLFLVPALAMG